MFKGLSIFVHRFNLLFLFWFINCCIWCVWRLCYGCCPLAVCPDQLWLILTGKDWTLQMSAYNLLIPFISGCCFWCMCVGLCTRACVCIRGCLSKTDGGRWLCLCVGNESISFTLVSSPKRGGRAPCLCIVCLSVSFLFLSLSVFSHMVPQFCHCCSLSHSSLALPVSSSASYLCIVSLYLSLSISSCLPIHSQFLSLAVFYYYVYFYFTIIHSLVLHLKLHLHLF